MKDKSRPAPLESQPSSSLSPLHPPSMVNLYILDTRKNWKNRLNFHPILVLPSMVNLYHTRYCYKIDRPLTFTSTSMVNLYILDIRKNWKNRLKFSSTPCSTIHGKPFSYQIDLSHLYIHHLR